LEDVTIEERIIMEIKKCGVKVSTGFILLRIVSRGRL
jgi:hypothetical protein